MTMEELIIRIKNEEVNFFKEKREHIAAMEAKENIAESSVGPKNYSKSSKCQHKFKDK